MDILLVNAPVKRISPHSRLSPPLGLAYIVAVLLEAGCNVSALDFNVSDTAWPKLRKCMEDNPPRILGISTCTETHLNGLRIARLAKGICPEVKVIIGGLHVSVLCEEAIGEEGIDVAVRGEGEQTMLELADYFIRGQGALSDIRGIACRQNGEIRMNGERQPFTDIDGLPYPARQPFQSHMYSYPDTVLTSRGGCPFNCHFCAVNNIWKGKRRFRKIEKLIDEISCMVRERDISELNFSDDAYTLDRGFVLQLCDLFRKTKGVSRLRWRFATRVDLVDEELLGEMSLAGCCSIQYGIEAGSQDILDSIGKRITLEQVKKAVRMTVERGIMTICSFMFPHTDDTEQTVKQQIALMKELKGMGSYITQAMTTPFPGTYYYKHAREMGIKNLAKNWEDYDCEHLLITTKYLSEERLQALLQEMVREVGLSPCNQTDKNRKGPGYGCVSGTVLSQSKNYRCGIITDNHLLDR